MIAPGRKGSSSFWGPRALVMRSKQQARVKTAGKNKENENDTNMDILCEIYKNNACLTETFIPERTSFYSVSSSGYACFCSIWDYGYMFRGLRVAPC